MDWSGVGIDTNLYTNRRNWKMERRRINNQNNRGDFLNGSVTQRLLTTICGMVLFGSLHHLFLLHQHLQNNDYVEHRFVRDEPQIPTVSVERRASAQMTTTTNDPAVTMSTEEYLQRIAAAESSQASKEDESNQEEKEEVEPEKDSQEEEKIEKPPYVDPKECETKTKRLNVALFYADDWTMKVLGKLDKNVKTPNIDAMAENGMIFTNNCVTTSVCWISRATLLTGTYSAIHQHHFPYDADLFENKVWSDTLYAKMRKGSVGTNASCRDGYYTGLFGKWHGLEIYDEFKEAFDKHRIYYGNHWEERDGKLQHVTELNKQDSIEFLDEWQEKYKYDAQKSPFFLTTSFYATHARDGKLPSYQPKNSTRLNIYPDSLEIPKPKTATEEHYQKLPRFLVEGNNEGRTRWKNRFEPKDFQKNIKDIYAMATEVDEAVGAIIEKIKSMGVIDETVLIFTTDNGNLHGEHGLAEKWYPFEESLRVPLVIQDPRMPQNRRGTMSDAWTLNVDLTPTILGVGNIPPSDFMQGRDIADLYLNNNDAIPDQASLSVDEMKEKVEWRKDFFYEFNMGKQDDGSEHPWKHYIDASFALVNDEWKYVYWPQHDYEQLFHRSVDPFDEWDLLDKIFRPKTTASFNDAVLSTTEGTQPRQMMQRVDDKNGCCDTVQTTTKMYKEMKERFAILKKKAQSGQPI